MSIDVAAGLRRRLVPRTGADGMLRGLRFVVQEVIDVAGQVTEGGTPDWAARGHPAARDADQVALCLAAGAELIGIAVSDELAFSVNGRNPHRPGLVNPCAPERLPGGSSGGCADAVAAGIADFALGPDVRMAATYCGVHGLRCSTGGASTRGQMPLAPSFDAVGIFARTPAILAQVASALVDGPAWQPRRLLLGMDGLELASAPVREAVEHAAQGLGLPVEPAIAVPRGLQALSRAFRIVQAAEAYRAFGAFLGTAPRVTDAVRARFEAGRSISTPEERDARATLTAIAADLALLLGQDGLLAIPSAPDPPPLIDAAESVLEPLRPRILALTSISGAGGLPQLCVPLAGNLTTGLSLLAPRHCDRGLAAWLAFR